MTEVKRMGPLFLSVALLLATVGCTDKSKTEDLATDESEIVGGVIDYNWMAIGRVWRQSAPDLWDMCTGTLIDKRIVLTAAHCVNYVDQIPVTDPNQFEFEITPTRGSSVIYKVVSIISRPTAYNYERDIALLKLDAAPPADIDRYPLATALPAAGTVMTAWGYGCTSQELDDRGYGVKRRRNFRWGTATDILCPGDSGGPLVTRDGGQIVGVNSAYCTDGVCDGWANVPKYLEWINTSIPTL